MQNLVNEAPAKKNYQFIDAIRGIAMMSIVAEHCVAAGAYDFAYGTPKYWAYTIMIQLFKFGTVIFFLLAGFLISEKFSEYSPAQYLKRRMASTFWPWLFWSTVCLLCVLVNLYVKNRIYHDGRFNMANILENVKLTYLYSNYWFIINFIVSLTILLVFRRYLYSIYLGTILCLFTIFYTINIHYEWVSPWHTTAILGFVFFLWLGAQMRRHWEWLEKSIEKIPNTLLIILNLVMFTAAIYEMLSLTPTSVDPLNTLRISNILFSLAAFVLLLKIKNFKFINYLNPRQTTFGIYLIHLIIVVIVLPEIFIHFNIDVPHLSVPGYLSLKLTDFILVYGITLGIVILLNKTRAKKLIGN
ncbi:acyltransferase [Mucilaginibacter corticis]|uniref:Acyltransferase n=1 Tax=Mucilaginibacter corticis TaxID=2597670 RepID=A0A556MWL0_9SPHI|nr:acyltransferase [Mucilaginibacter corticis]TSJ44255.1 acyltransferase [Mucilaginibacter corticis]